MADNETRERILIETRESGAAQATAILEKFAAAQEKAAAATTGLTKATLDGGRGFDAVSRRYDEEFRAREKLTEVYRKGELAVATGARTQAEVNRVWELAVAKVLPVTAALEQHSASMALNRAQAMELMHVSRSLFDGLAAGANPIRLLAMEGGRIGEVFSMGTGGVGGTLRAVGAAAAGLATPFVAVGATVVAASAAAVASLTRWQNAQDALSRSLNGVGRGSGSTLEGLNSIAERGAAAGGIGTGEARDLVAGYAHTGRINAAMNEALTGATKQYSIASNQTVAEAGADLAKAMSDPTRGMDQMQERLGPLSAATRDLVRSQQAAGDTFLAQKTLLGAYADQMTKATDTSWAFTRGLKAVKDAAGSAMDAIGRHLAPDPLSVSMDMALRAAMAAQAASSSAPVQARRAFLSFGQGIDPANPQPLDYGDNAKFLRAQSDYDAMERHRALADRRALATGADAQENLRSQPARGAALEALPDIAQLQKLTEGRDLLDTALGQNYEGAAKLGLSIEQAKKAQDAFNQAIKTNLPSMDKQRQEGDLILRGIQAETLAERAAIAADRERLSLAGALKDSVEGRLLVEQASGRVVAEANKAASDQLRTTMQQSALIGLNPLARSLMENQQRHDDFADKNTLSGSPDRSGSWLLPNGMMNPATAFDYLTKQRGLSDAQAAGLLGNAQQESSLNPNITNGSHRGLFQAEPSRQSALQDPKSQIDYYLNELRTSEASKGGADFFKASTVEQAAAAIFRTERSGDNSLASRVGYGRHFLSEYGGTAEPITGGIKSVYGTTTLGGVPSTSGASVAADRDMSARNIIRAAEIKPIDDATAALAAQNRMLDANNKAFGLSAGEAAKVIEQQRLLNQYALAGVGVNDALRASIDRQAEAEGRRAQAEAESAKAHRELISSMDTVRSINSTGLSTFIGDLEQGKRFADAFKDSLKSMANVATQRLEGGLMDALWGKQGSAGGSPDGGLLGGGLASLLKGFMPGFSGPGAPVGAPLNIVPGNATGTDYWSGGPTLIGERGPEILNLPRGSQIIPNNAATGKAPPAQITHAPVYNIDARYAQPGMEAKLAATLAAHTADMKRNILGYIAQADRHVPIR